MYYRLAGDVGLRTWADNPCGYFRRGERSAGYIAAPGFALLGQCDGLHDLAPSPALALLCLQGLAEPCGQGDTIAGWQRLRACENPCIPAINWAVTQRCNYNCRHCFMASENGHLHKEFSWQECLALIDEIEACGIWRVSLTGGEPLLHPHFARIVGELSSRGITLFEIATNGALLGQEMLALLAASGQRPLMKISFDGLNHHDWLRGCEGAEEAALEAISLCHANGFPVRVQMNVHRGNLACIPASMDAVEALGAEQVRVIRTSEAPRWQQSSPGGSLGFAEYYDAMCALLGHYLSRPRRTRLTLWQFAELDAATKTYHNRPVKFCRQASDDALPVCEMNRLMVSVTGAGEVVPCNQMEGLMEGMGMSFGNVHQMSMQALLRAGAYHDAAMATIGAVRRHNPKTCGACPHWALCAGGCRALALGLTGDMMGRDPAKCAYFAGGYIEKVRDVFSKADGWRCTDALGETN